MRNLAIDKLNRNIADETRTPEQRENSRRLRDTILRMWEKRAVMEQCPALCLMELIRANDPAGPTTDVVFQYTNRDFWRNEAFCREAVKINGESLEWVDDAILKKWKEQQPQ